MEDCKGLKTFLRWTGLVAIIAIPVIILLKKRKNYSSDVTEDDEYNIFSPDFE